MKTKDEQIIFGLQPVKEAIKAGKDFERLYIYKGMSKENFSELRILTQEHQIAFQMVPVEKLNHLVQGNHQGVVGIISHITYHTLENVIAEVFEKGKTPFIVIIDRVTDVRNLGALARTAECMGVDALIIPLHESAMIHAEAIKTSSGALARIPLCRVENLKYAVNYLKASGLAIVSISEKGNRSFSDVDFTGPIALILGSEENGINKALLRLSDEICFIPMMGNIGSLNVSVAGGIAMYEVVRQRINKNP